MFRTCGSGWASRCRGEIFNKAAGVVALWPKAVSPLQSGASQRADHGFRYRKLIMTRAVNPDGLRRSNRVGLPASNAYIGCMPDHPSLQAPFVAPPAIQPTPSMKPYKPCWCGSGHKFKFCHFRRETMSPVNVFEMDARLRADFERGYCSHPAASPTQCKGGITKAHTVQRRGGLAAISEAGHVLTLKPTLKGMIEHEGKPPPRKIGVGSASVFPGFCNHHDSALFKRVEGDDLALGIEEAFLLSYRAIAYERFSKDVQLKSLLIQRQMDRGQPFWKQAIIQTQTYALEWGVRRGMIDVERWKATYDNRLLSGSRDGFKFLAIRFNGLLPIVACAAFHVEVDFNGNLLQRLARGNLDFDHIALNVTAHCGRTVVILGWIGSASGPAAAFASSLQALSDNRKADAMVRMVFEQSENVFMNPTWWRCLSTEQQRGFIDQAWSGTPQSARKLDCLIDRGSNYASAEVSELVTG